MSAIVVVGGGGHAKVVISILRKLSRFRILGYIDPKNNGEILGIPYLGPDSELAAISAQQKSLDAVIAVGQVELGNPRCALWENFQSLTLSFPPIVSPDAIVNEAVEIGEGSVVMDGAVVNPGANIGRGAIVNTNSTVEHDVTLADWVHVAPGATICGNVTIGSFSMIGAGATIIQGRIVGANCIIGAGATVVHDLPEAGIYLGCPARRVG